MATRRIRSIVIQAGSTGQVGDIERHRPHDSVQSCQPESWRTDRAMESQMHVPATSFGENVLGLAG